MCPIVFTNGVFDLLHAGHVASFTTGLEMVSAVGQSRLAGSSVLWSRSILVVGVNSDESALRCKGANRPLVEYTHRADLLASLRCVDLVVGFPEDTPEELIRYLDPYAIFKGSDYDGKEIAGEKWLIEHGGFSVRVPRVPGLSTSEILGNLKTGL